MVPALVNLALPGSGLVLRDRLLCGLPLLVIAAAAVVVALAAGLIATPAFAGDLRTGALATYAGAAVVAGALWWALEVPRPSADERVIELHRAAATAYLIGDHASAIARARELVRAADGSPGAWELLALTAEAGGDAALARRARRRAGRAAARAA